MSPTSHWGWADPKKVFFTPEVKPLRLLFFVFFSHQAKLVVPSLSKLSDQRLFDKSIHGNL
jgi:hypothetical protein